MLKEIIALIDEGDSGLTLPELARRLDVPPGLLHHMLLTLVQRGRLEEVGPDQRVCTSCGDRPTCLLLALSGARYRIPRPPL